MSEITSEITSEVNGAAKWIDARLLESYPHGPYAVYAYFPATCRELVQRNQTPEGAARSAEGLAAQGCRVHVSLDTCG